MSPSLPNSVATKPAELLKEVRDARDKRLDDLKAAVDEWADVEIKRLGEEAKFLKSILLGRTGAGRLANQNADDSSKLLTTKIAAFLQG